MACRSAMWLLILGIANVTSCTGGARQRAVKMGPTDTGAGSIESVRRSLQGTWILERFELVNPSGPPTPVKADAILRYDEFGNLSVRGKLLEPLPGGATDDTQSMLAFEGRAVIDADRHELRVQVPEGGAPAPETLKSRIGTELVRQYQLSGQTLTFRYIGPDGAARAVTVFRRQP